MQMDSEVLFLLKLVGGLGTVCVLLIGVFILGSVLGGGPESKPRKAAKDVKTDGGSKPA